MSEQPLNCDTKPLVLVVEAGVHWWCSCGRSAHPLEIEQADQAEATLVVPEKFGRAGTCHLIVAVTDSGSPPLTRYERVIVTIEPKR
jgi:hypothetical protein